MTEYESAIEEAKSAARNFESTKKEIIFKCRDILIKNNHPEDTVSTKICDDLKGYIDSSYIRRLLGNEFKDKAKQREKQIINNDGSVANVTETETANPSLSSDSKGSDDLPNENKYYAGAKQASKSMQKQIEKEKESDNDSENTMLAVEHSIELNEEILEQIKILTEQNNVKKVWLKVNTRNNEVITVQAVP